MPLVYTVSTVMKTVLFCMYFLSEDRGMKEQYGYRLVLSVA